MTPPRHRPSSARRPSAREREERPSFTAAQLAWLREMLRPRCCHISGMHSPTHFVENKYVCSAQEHERYDALMKALRFREFTPQEAVSKPDCAWCNGFDGHKGYGEKRERNALAAARPNKKEK